MSSKTKRITSPYQFARNSNYLNRARVGGSLTSKITSHILKREDYETFVKKKMIYQSKSVYEP